MKGGTFVALGALGALALIAAQPKKAAPKTQAEPNPEPPPGPEPDPRQPPDKPAIPLIPGSHLANLGALRSALGSQGNAGNGNAWPSPAPSSSTQGSPDRAYEQGGTSKPSTTQGSPDRAYEQSQGGGGLAGGTIVEDAPEPDFRDRK